MTNFRGIVARVVTTAAVATAGIIGTTGVAQAMAPGPDYADTAATDYSPASYSTTNYYGAIAISVRSGNVGYAWDYPSADAARNGARNKCSRSDCRTVVVVANGCAALAQAQNRAIGWAWAASPTDAQRRAVNATRGRGARVVGWMCTTGHR